MILKQFQSKIKMKSSRKHKVRNLFIKMSINQFFFKLLGHSQSTYLDKRYGGGFFKCLKKYESTLTNIMSNEQTVYKGGGRGQKCVHVDCERPLLHKMPSHTQWKYLGSKYMAQFHLFLYLPIQMVPRDKNWLQIGPKLSM